MKTANLRKLKTERPNRASAHLDQLNALEIATLMNRQDAQVLRAIKASCPPSRRPLTLSTIVWPRRPPHLRWHRHQRTHRRPRCL